MANAIHKETLKTFAFFWDFAFSQKNAVINFDFHLFSFKLQKQEKKFVHWKNKCKVWELKKERKKFVSTTKSKNVIQFLISN